MAKANGRDVRRRKDIDTNKDTEDRSDSDEKSGDKDKKMKRWIPRLFYSYRLLILFSLVVCILQFLVGFSFFHTFSHRVSNKPAPTEERKDAEPRISSSSATGLSFPCNITGKEAVSAINRATTMTCKQEMVDLVCSLENGKVYPTSLKRTCPTQVDEEIQGHHLGCYKDSFNTRLLQGYLVKLKTQNSPVVCTQICTKSGFSFAGDLFV